MIIHTTMPLELVLQGSDSEPPAYLEIPIPGGLLVVEQLSPGSGRIVRLVSTNVQDYLRPEWQPGMTISLRYQEE